MSSGVKVQDEVKLTFQKMKEKKICSYMFLAMTKDNTEVEIAKCSRPCAKFCEFYDEIDCLLKENQCRYVVGDFMPTEDADMKDGKLIVFIWSPETAKIKDKMLYTSTYGNVLKALGDGFKQVPAKHDMSDVEFSEIVSHLKS